MDCIQWALFHNVSRRSRQAITPLSHGAGLANFGGWLGAAGVYCEMRASLITIPTAFVGCLVALLLVGKADGKVFYWAGRSGSC